MFNYKLGIVTNLAINEHLQNLLNRKPHLASAQQVLDYLQRLEAETPGEIVDAIAPKVV